ncbi:cytochrome c-type biogenesis protein [Agarivorans sp.]|uniref:cytochrome c-type biogenesis protein n=1 Tax=Agarivorans sp. TaxID=1872412 RepID=UPI003D0150A1
MNQYLKAFTLLLALFMSTSLSAAIDVHEFDSPEQEQLFRELTRELRCPKCQNNNIADSNAGLAQDLREKTYQMVKQGNTKQQVLDYMVARYGNFVRYDPPLTPAVMLLWAAPLSIIVLGLLVVLRVARRRADAKPELDADEKQRLEALIKQTEQDK